MVILRILRCCLLSSKLSHPFIIKSSGLHLIKKRKAHPISYETESLCKVGITGGRGKFTPLIPLYKFTYTMRLYKDGYMNTEITTNSSSIGFQKNHLIEKQRCKYSSFVFCFTAPASSTSESVINPSNYFLWNQNQMQHLKVRCHIACGYSDYFDTFHINLVKQEF